jgi:hypothetical protein
MPVVIFPLSLAQERLWFIEQFSPGTATYNTPIVLDVTGPLEHSIVERALGEIVRRHEPLRTVIQNDGGRPQQAVQPYELFVLPVEELAGVGLTDEQVTHGINDEIRRPVDLERSPIFRGRLLRLDDGRHVLVLAAKKNTRPGPRRPLALTSNAGKRWEYVCHSRAAEGVGGTGK